jgi:hypothetical protein
MSVHERNVAATSADNRITSEIRALLALYGATFVDLTVGERTHMDAVLEFYGAPLRFIGDDFHLIIKDVAAIIGADGVGGEIRRLRIAGGAASTVDSCDVSVLNRGAAFVNVIWARRDEAGVLLAKFGVVYLICLTEDGWRVTAAVATLK